MRKRLDAKQNRSLRKTSPMAIVNGMRPIHPGEILREEFMAPMGLPTYALAIALRVPAPRISDIVRERRAVSADTALRLARYFGTSAEFWLGLQSDYDMKIADLLTPRHPNPIPPRLRRRLPERRDPLQHDLAGLVARRVREAVAERGFGGVPVLRAVAREG